MKFPLYRLVRRGPGDQTTPVTVFWTRLKGRLLECEGLCLLFSSEDSARRFISLCEGGDPTNPLSPLEERARQALAPVIVGAEPVPVAAAGVRSLLQNMEQRGTDLVCLDPDRLSVSPVQIGDFLQRLDVEGA
jgi:hypothetical protein